jgi:hypothetical protein
VIGDCDLCKGYTPVGGVRSLGLGMYVTSLALSKATAVCGGVYTVSSEAFLIVELGKELAHLFF